MKKYLLLLLALCSVQTLAAPLLEKITTPGFIAPSAALSKSCVIQTTGTQVIEYKLGNLTSKRATLLKLDMAAIKAAIDSAALGTLTTGQSIADTGRVAYNAYQLQTEGRFNKIVLWEIGGIAPHLNQDSFAMQLRNFIDLNCNEPLLY